MKLYIVGPVASGKSTLARQLSRETGIPCFHLDQVARRQDPGAKVGNRKRRMRSGRPSSRLSWPGRNTS